MKILQVIPNYSPRMGGVVGAVRSISKELVRNGHEVVVLTTDYYVEEAEIDAGISAVFLRNWFVLKNFCVSPGIIIWLIRNLSKYDVIHLHDFRTFQNIFVAFWGKYLKIPIVLSPHGTFLIFDRLFFAKKLYDRLFGKWIAKFSAQIFAVSNYEIEELKHWGLPDEKISLIYNGANLEEFETLPPRGQFREKMGLGKDTHIVLGLGRLHYVKGFDFLISAFKKVIDEQEGSSLIIVGPDEGVLDELKELRERLSIRDKVIFPGPLYGQDKLAAYQDADVFVLSSRTESFGLVVFEALMCGTPVIVSDTVGVKDFISKYGAGFVTPDGDTESLAQNILRVLKKGGEIEKSVQSGQRYIKEFYSWPEIVEKIEKVYVELVN